MSKTKEILIPKAILTDVDCTLLNSKRRISAKNTQIIKNYLAESQQNPQLPKLALCTARHPAALINTVLPIFTKITPESLHVACDGGMLINAKNEIIWQEAIDSKIVKEICRQVEKLGGSFAFGSGEAFYCGDLFLQERQKVDESIQYLPYAAIKKQEKWTTALVIVSHLNQKVEKYLKFLKDEYHLHLQKFVSTFNQQYYYNVTLNRISKASGLKKWAEYHHLDTKEIMMVGDSDNDIEAMETGIGVAVANAKPSVKEIADTVLDQSNDDGAVAWLLGEIMRRVISPH